MLDGVEGHGEREVGQVGVDAASAAGRAERHLVFFEVVVFDALLELAEEEVVRDEVLLGKACGIDGLDASKVGEIALVAVSGGGERVIAELVVVAIVPDGGSEGGVQLESGLPGVVEEGVLGGQARVYRGGRLGRGELSSSGEEESEGDEGIGTHAERVPERPELRAQKIQAAGQGWVDSRLFDFDAEWVKRKTCWRSKDSAYFRG
jgi:hypothetical protein